MRRAEREHLKSVNECKRRRSKLSASGQFVKAGKELEDATESMREAYGITPDETYKNEAKELMAAARAEYTRERSIRPTPEISEILAEFCEKYEGTGVNRYYRGEAEQIRARENHSTEFHALMEVYRTEKEIIEEIAEGNLQSIPQLFEKIIELLSGAARGLELHGVNELKDRLHTLANTAYGHPSEVDKIDKAMRKITHHRVIKGSEKVRKQRAAKSAWEWANQNCR